MENFVSEPISPHRGTFMARPMAGGLPGLPGGFDWRGKSYEIREVLETWKQSGAEHGRAQGEIYLRRHYFKIKMSDAAVWTVYFTRQAARGGPAKRRWFLYSIDA
ncbi:MAG: cytoplasmic protein [Phycisphaerae bacterium]|nr:cytoplasmic protein [Phycisphaerae bacterium]HOO17021.1 DUF6504 family protein [Phycisphaerae bacterium]HRS29468.1 DUF6504 family protein [Phycisphaerae bacterium]HRT43406.1 DUF6504 family protein [Phycisphaerae bacterium]